jgi:hypothetical protein
MLASGFSISAPDAFQCTGGALLHAAVSGLQYNSTAERGFLRPFWAAGRVYGVKSDVMWLGLFRNAAI